MVTTPAPEDCETYRMPLHVEALELYFNVATGKHPALSAAKVPAFEAP